MEAIRRWSPDFIVVAAFGQILKPEILALPLHGCLNVHASLLPRWRGAAPIQAALLAGDAEAGVTIMKMDQGVDTGGILSQRRIPVDAGDTQGSLSAKLADVGAELLMETLPGYLSGELRPQPQDENRATRAPLLRKADGMLDFKLEAPELERRVRAFNPWPGAYFEWEGHLLKIHRAHVEWTGTAPGSRLVHRGEAAVGTPHGLLVLDEVQPAGRHSMSGKAFLAGARNWATREMSGE
jgi:methionyl-tRNA formyltransferase